MTRKPATPTIAVRRHRRTDGTTSCTYSVRFRDEQGRRLRRSFPTPEEAEFERARLVLEHSRTAVTTAPAQPPAGAASPTVGEFWDTYVADARSRLARSTVESYEVVYRRRVQPRFGHVPMSEIRPRAVSQWRAALFVDGTGAESARRAMVLLQAMFTVALEWGEVQSNPVALVRKPRQGRDHAVQPLTPEAVEAIRSEMLDAGDRRSAALTALMAYAGLRPGEALGLEVRHVRSTTVLVERAVSDGRLKRQDQSRLPNRRSARAACRRRCRVGGRGAAGPL